MEAVQGFYAGRVFPWLNDWRGRSADLERLRTEAPAQRLAFAKPL
jgi:hypothetical protein